MSGPTNMKKSTSASAPPRHTVGIVQSGMKSHHLGPMAHHGDFQANDDQVKEVRANYLNKLDFAVTKYVMGSDGKPSKFMSVNGREYMAGPNGGFRELDGDALDIMVQLQDEIDEEINRKIDYCLISDAHTAILFGIPPNEYEALFGPTNAIEVNANGMGFINDVIPNDILAADCRTRWLKIFGQSESATAAAAFAKLRGLLGIYCPIVKKSGTSGGKLLDQMDAIGDTKADNAAGFKARMNDPIPKPPAPAEPGAS